MKGVKQRLNIDKLTLCYIAPKRVVKGLEHIKEKVFDGFKLTHIDSDIPIETRLQISIPASDNNNKYKEYAIIKIGNKFEKKKDKQRYVWVIINNKVFYGYNEDSNELSHIYNIANCLNLEFHNITELHIAINSNINWFKRIKKAIRNLSLTPIILGRKYENEKEVIDKILYIHTSDRRRYRTDTMTIKNSDKDMEINIYDKSKEIEESNKKYIADDFGSNTNIFRNEVRIKKTALRDYLKFRIITWEDFYFRLTEMKFLFDVFIYYENRIIRFKDENRNTISVLQL